MRSSTENLPSTNQHHDTMAHHQPYGVGVTSQIPHLPVRPTSCPPARSISLTCCPRQCSGSPMPLTPMVPVCPPMTPNGPSYHHYNDNIPPGSLLPSSQSFQQHKTQQYQNYQSLVDLPSSHSQSTAQLQQKPQPHAHFSSNQYQESYPHTQTHQHPLPQSQQRQHLSASPYLGSFGQSGLPNHAQNYQLNSAQQVRRDVSEISSAEQKTMFFLAQASTFSSSSIPPLRPSVTYTSSVPTTYGTQLGHHMHSVAQTTLPTLSSYSGTSLQPTLGTLYSVPATALSLSTASSSLSSVSTYSNVGSSALGTSMVNTGNLGVRVECLEADPEKCRQERIQGVYCQQLVIRYKRYSNFLLSLKSISSSNRPSSTRYNKVCAQLPPP